MAPRLLDITERAELTCFRAEAGSVIRERIRIGRELQDRAESIEAMVEQLSFKADTVKWMKFNADMLKRFFTTNEIEREYDSVSFGVQLDAATNGGNFNMFCENIADQLRTLESILERLDLYREPPKNTSAPAQWVTAAGALELLKLTMGAGAAAKAICTRANDGMIGARAERFIEASKAGDDVEIPSKFWWARGEAALTQNWITGDFETWIDQRIHLKAYGVSFLRADIEKMTPAGSPAPAAAQAPPAPTVTTGGRPPAEFWDDLWIEIFRQIYLGELKPKTQADITNAMLTWIEHRGEKASESTVKPRARRLFKALQSWDKN
jgi:hypothetical protein